jgi:hypothetical protein
MHQKQPPATMATATFSWADWAVLSRVDSDVSAGPEQANVREAVSKLACLRRHGRVVFI